MESQVGLIEQSFHSSYSFCVREALVELPDNFTITDPCMSGHPIVFASHGFLKMTGYTETEVIGQNGRIFQGPGTSRRSVMEIREAIREERAIQIHLLNYRKDGTPFWMLFHMCPVFNKEDGRVIHFVGVQVPILRKPRRLGSGSGRNGVDLCEEGSTGMHDVVYGSCRREVCSDSLLELDHVLARESPVDTTNRGCAYAGFEIEEPCEASDMEKRRAVTAINNILSVLTHYSELTGKLVCGKRCSLSGVGLPSSSLNISLGRIKQSFVLIDPYLPDMPVVYASDAFLKLTGYARHEVLGHNYRFLSGLDTDSLTLCQIKESIKMERACTVRILNYRKDRSSFWNILHMSPVRNASGKIAYFVGVQTEEACKKQEEHEMSPEMRQLSAVGAVKVAVRSSSMAAGSSRS
ncbi:protein TWIN LOV 1 isoform X1 [Ziziphus jujuba]|uniref:Protein TWIN LOV 1 isoform X1 n=1 Tax=Ziziphus jujuba TaxID=326968 RepID=A0ABM3I1D0_ZIZJJ|nr:protein TWIN LOV 1 isoform X1 [Ziziphus jujuba]XP_024925863.2 protein TWIN LOV 1 isoform X1 [Ziziphus jujuba]XP_048318589.2 protein TWIN LOV 1 isoform X1 [Ziziphus jujuba]